MGNGVEIMKFNFDTDHSGKLAGPPQPGRDGLGKRQKHFQGSGPFGDIGGKGCGIPNAFGGMTFRVDGGVFQPVGIFPDGLTVGF